MSEMTARIRNRVQDRVIDWQERRYQEDDFRQQHADIHRSRMTCSASLPSFHQTQDWTGGLTASGRVPVIEETKPKQRLISAEGIASLWCFRTHNQRRLHTGEANVGMCAPVATATEEALQTDVVEIEVALGRCCSREYVSMLVGSLDLTFYAQGVER